MLIPLVYYQLLNSTIYLTSLLKAFINAKKLLFTLQNLNSSTPFLCLNYSSELKNRQYPQFLKIMVDKHKQNNYNFF